jgi:uncharacterized protein YfaS (alpha-2-macroglobulin family)
MKHLVRRPVLAGFARPDAAALPDTVRIQHVGSETPVELPLEFAADGSALSEWAIPKEARLGAYEIALVRAPLEPDGAPAVFASGRFRVEEFRLPLLTGALQPPAEPLVDRREFPLDVALRYLAGGPARGLETTLRTQLRPRGVHVEDWEEFAFLSGSVREGIERRSFDDDASAEAAAPEVHTQQLVLDAAGGARATLGGLPASEGPTELVAELAFRDPNGETQTLSRTLPLWPAARMIGLRVASEFAVDEPLRVEAVVLDLARRPVRSAPVRVEAFGRETASHRKRLVGGFYAYEHVTETKRVGLLCEGHTDGSGRFACEAPAPASGEIVLRASTRDEAGRVAATHVERWLPGEEDWYAADASDRMDLLPDRRRYEPGDVAFVHVRLPFREATALVTVEREGVAEAFVKRLSGREPWVAVPIQGAFAPNVFVSVLAVRGRVDAPRPSALVDLARPAMRLGLTKLRVGWRAHELRVSVAPEREVHRPRETAKLRVRVRTPDGDLPPPGSELAVAAVDEGLLELAPNPSWQLLEAMEDERAQEVRTSTAQLQVVGKRHHGQKAVPSGGGGGGRPTRELFDTLLAWQPRVPLDRRGEARLEIPLNDSLTSFRIVALATAGADRFGTGSASVRATQELMVLAGMPPLAREGDRLRPEFTLRNSTEGELTVTAALRVEGLGREIAPERVTLGPGEARAVGFALEVPPGVRELAYQLDASSEGGGPADRIRVVQRVLPAVPERVVQATLLQLDGPVSLPVAKPGDALPGRGALEVALRPSLANGSQGIEQFFRAYPYHCLEQRVSRAIGLRDASLWQGVAADLPAHLDGDGLAKFFPALREGSDVLTSYVLATAHEAGWQLPEASRARMLDALEGFVDGHIRRGRFAPMNDLPLRKLASLEALARHGRDVTARLSALPRQPELWPTSALLDGASLLRRLPPDAARGRELARIEKLLRARLTLGGTTLGFSTEAADTMDWLLATAELNLVRLVGLAHESPAFRGDLPRLVKGALGRQRRGAWATTLANAWGRLALERFSRAFEAAPVAGETEVALAGEARSVAWAGEAPAPLRLPWPLGPSEVALRHRGTGAPWAELRAVAAVPLTQPLFAGYTVARRWTPLEQKTPGLWSRGDLVRVRLDVDAQSDAAWVVISDPIPAGASLLGSGLGRDSALATEGEQTEGDGWGCPCRAFTERSFEAYRDYFEYVPKGRFAVEYTLRLDQAGRFGLPPTRVEAMYAPESFAELPHDPLEVAP